LDGVLDAELASQVCTRVLGLPVRAINSLTLFLFQKTQQLLVIFQLRIEQQAVAVVVLTQLAGKLMIVAQRNYQSNAQTIKTQDSILNTLVNLR